VSTSAVTGDGRLKGTAIAPWGEDGGTFGGKNASLMSNPSSGSAEILVNSRYLGRRNGAKPGRSIASAMGLGVDTELSIRRRLNRFFIVEHGAEHSQLTVVGTVDVRVEPSLATRGSSP
jgi:hypothetical protein